MTARTRSYFLLFVATLIWGIAGPITKNTLSYFPPLIFLFYRFVIAGFFAILSFMFFHHNGWPKDRIQKLWILVFCFINSTVVLGLYFLGLEKTSALTSSILNAIAPILTALVGMWFLHEHITHRENIGMGIALIGTGLIVAEPYLSGQTGALAASSLQGELLLVASVIVSVVGSVLAKVLLRHKLSAFSLTQLTFLVGLITTAPIAFYYYSPWEIVNAVISAPWQAHAGVWFMALVSGSLAYSLWNFGQKTIEIGESAMFSYLYPIITLPLSIFWLHENVSWIYATSSAVITVGIILAETKKARR